MRTLSVITPCGPDRTYLRDTGLSLARQVLPYGWHLEWVVVQDGGTPHRGLDDLGLNVVHECTHERARGPAAARNVAAAHATGEVLFGLDADDMLADDSLGLLLDDLLEHGAGWTAWSNWDVVDSRGDLIEQRTTPVPPGPVAVGTLGAMRRKHGRMPFPPSAIMMRREALWEAGAWPALPVEEDVALLLAIDALYDGWLSPSRGLLCRRHSEQATAQPDRLPFGEVEKWLRKRRLA